MVRDTLLRAVAACLLAPAALPAAAEPVRLEIVDARAGPNLPEVCCLSGADTLPDGSLLIVSDKSTLFEAELDAGAGRLTLTHSAPLTLSDGTPLPKWRADAEGVAIGPGDKLHITFEGDHRAARYDGARGVSSAPAPTDLGLPKNGGLEALAVDAGGTLWAIPETARGTGFPLLRLTGSRWEAAGALHASGGYLPVGADFDAAGALYVLERKFSFLRFQGRVRRLTLGPGGIEGIETVWEGAPGAYDNLEALVVIEGGGQPKSLLMISDDNGLPVQETQALLLKLDVD